MCGIVGYTGSHEASPILLAGLRRLEYRGYDSAGLAVVGEGDLVVRKRSGRVRMLEEALVHEPVAGHCGISHTRWATHGPATDRNAHPHVGGDGVVAVVHNGVIENHADLRRELEGGGYAFRSQTDTEVVAHLIARELGDGDDLFGALQACPGLSGGDLRPGRRQPEVSRHDRRSPPGEPPGRRRGRGRAPAGERRLGHRLAHRERLVPPGRRGDPPDAPRLRDPAPRARADHPADRPHRLPARRRRAGRPRALHGQGDPRAARRRPRRLPGPTPTRRGDRAVRRPEPDRPPAPAGPARRPGRLRHELARGPGRRIPDRAPGPPARRGRVRRASSATETPRSTTARSSSS